MADNSTDYLADSLAAPLGNLIAAIGEGVGEAQAALDQGSLAQTLALYSNTEEQDHITSLLRQVGYQPTFYSIPETRVKAKVSLALTQSTEENFTGTIYPNSLSKMRIYGAPINASVTNKFNVNVNASAELEFTIKPVPPLIDSDARVVPDLVGKTYEEAVGILERLGLEHTISGLEEGQEPKPEETVQSQDPKKNTPIRTGDSVQLTFLRKKNVATPMLKKLKNLLVVADKKNK